MQQRREEISQLQETLKQFMGAKKRSLSDLAVALGVSIATAKRLLNGDDLSLDRVLQICSWLNLSFSDLVEVATRRRSEYHYCSIEQEEYLASHPGHYSFLRALQKGDTLRGIRAKFAVSVPDCRAYLSDLAEQGFLDLSGEDTFTLRIKDGMDWRPGGPLWERYLKGWVMQFAERATSRDGVDPDSIVEVSQRKLSRQSFQDLKHEIYELSRKYASISRIEREVQDPDSLDYHSCFFFADRWNAPVWDVVPYGKSNGRTK